MSDANFISDPDLYEKLEQPLPQEEATQKCKEFYEKVCKLREEYHIPEFVIAFAINFVDDADQKVKSKPNIGFRGGKLTEALMQKLFMHSHAGRALSKLVDEVNLTDKSLLLFQEESEDKICKVKTLHPNEIAGKTINYACIAAEFTRYKKIFCKAPKDDKLQTYDLKIGLRTFLILDCYGNDFYVKELEERIFHSGIRDIGYTIAIDKNSGEVYLCLFNSENKKIRIFLQSLYRTVPEKFLSRIDQLKYQKRPFRIGFSDIDLLKFIDHELSYYDLKENFKILLRFNKFTLEFDQDLYNLVSRKSEFVK